MPRTEYPIEKAIRIVQGAEGTRAREAQALIAEARALQGAIASGFWDLGRVLGELASKKLHVTLGFDRFEVMVVELLGISKTLAWRLVAVAGKLPKNEAMKLGQERAHALVSYAAATKGEIDPVEVARYDRPLVGDRPISQTPVREILAARPRRPKPLAQRAIAANDKRLAAALRRQTTAMGLRGAEIEVRDDHVTITITRRRAEKIIGE